jgi:hypothetical protein
MLLPKVVCRLCTSSSAASLLPAINSQYLYKRQHCRLPATRNR